MKIKPLILTLAVLTTITFSACTATRKARRFQKAVLHQ